LSFTYDQSLQKVRDPVRSPLVKLKSAGLVVGSVTTSESPVLYVFLFFLGILPLLARSFDSCYIMLQTTRNCHIRPKPLENTGSRPLSLSQAKERRTSSWVGDDQRIPGVVCFYFSLFIYFFLKEKGKTRMVCHVYYSSPAVLFACSSPALAAVLAFRQCRLRLLTSVASMIVSVMKHSCGPSQSLSTGPFLFSACRCFGLLWFFVRLFLHLLQLHEGFVSVFYRTLSSWASIFCSPLTSCLGAPSLLAFSWPGMSI
jgi:hypothetical protein